MEIPETTKSEKRLILTLGKHQDEEEPKNMSELCEEIEEPLQALQRGKSKMISEGFIESRREHPSTHLYLTEKGKRLYNVLEDYSEIMSE